MRHSQGDHWDLMLLEPAGGDSTREAGFKNRADLGFYLRSLLISHRDTLAVPVGD